MTATDWRDQFGHAVRVEDVIDIDKARARGIVCPVDCPQCSVVVAQASETPTRDQRKDAP